MDMESTESISNTRRTRTALFVDFDNIFTGLNQLDPAAADVFANRPYQWLAWLERTSAAGNPDLSPTRSILVRRCYLNPGAFGRFRPLFVRSGFQVVDCPALTVGGKNGADIQVVMDILDTLNHPTRFEQFIILSGDSDFTPVLHRLRAHDRVTTVLAVGLSAAAFRAAADTSISEETFVAQALQLKIDPSEPQDLLQEQRTGGVLAISASGSPVVSPRSMQDLADAAVAEIQSMVNASEEPVVSASVAQRLRQLFPELQSPGWAGKRRLREFVESLPAHDFEVSWAIPGLFYDPDRHDIALPPVEAGVAFELGDPPLEDFARRASSLADVPLLHPEEYTAVFEAIDSEIAEKGFLLSRTTKSVRDVTKERGHAVSRQDVNFIVKGIIFSGLDLADAGVKHDPETLADVFRENVVRLLAAAQTPTSEEERRLLDRWIPSARPRAG